MTLAWYTKKTDHEAAAGCHEVAGRGLGGEPSFEVLKPPAGTIRSTVVQGTPRRTPMHCVGGGGSLLDAGPKHSEQQHLH